MLVNNKNREDGIRAEASVIVGDNQDKKPLYSYIQPNAN